MALLSQALHLGYLLSPHSAFQGHAAHTARWPAMLSPNGSSDTCIADGVFHIPMPCFHGAIPVYPKVITTFLHTASRRTRRAIHASRDAPCHSSAQPPLLGGLPPPHGAFQEHAAHLVEWSTTLSSKGSSGTCIPDGVATFFHAAFTAHSGSDAGADAVGSRLQPIVRPRRASTIQDLTPLCRTLFRLARSVQCSGMTSQLADAYLARGIFRVGVGPAVSSPLGDPPCQSPR